MDDKTLSNAECAARRNSSDSPSSARRSAAYLLMIAAELLGGCSLVLFGIFLFVGPVVARRLAIPAGGVLVWDALLSVVFFAQHSVMVRGWFKDRLAAYVPRDCHAAIYAVASGVALAAAMSLWQPTPVIAAAPEPWRWVLRAVAGLTIVGFVWGLWSLRSFDSFGRRPITARLRGQTLPRPEFVVRGPYRWVRHPLMTFLIVLMWAANPDLSADRVLFNVLWTAWMAGSLVWEEGDLVREFGPRYREYQRAVPMLVPWRGPAGRHLAGGVQVG